jgi:hypothetical protein
MCLEEGVLSIGQNIFLIAFLPKCTAPQPWWKLNILSGKIIFRQKYTHHYVVAAASARHSLRDSYSSRSSTQRPATERSAVSVLECNKDVASVNLGYNNQSSLFSTVTMLKTKDNR